MTAKGAKSEDKSFYEGEESSIKNGPEPVLVAPTGPNRNAPKTEARMAADGQYRDSAPYGNPKPQDNWHKLSDVAWREVMRVVAVADVPLDPDQMRAFVAHVREGK